MTEIDESLVNHTCTISYAFDPDIINVYRMFVGGGAFIVPDENGHRVVTGIHGISSKEKIDIVTFWTQSEDANQNLDNSTCGDAAFLAMECEPTVDGKQKEGVFFMETANDFRRPKGSTYNFQIAGVKPGDTLNIQLVDALGNPFECNNFFTHTGLWR